jgi:hypothetical protein
MRPQYDFSGGERGKFYHPQAEISLPVHLEPDVSAFLLKVASAQGIEVETLVNEWMRKKMVEVSDR